MNAPAKNRGTKSSIFKRVQIHYQTNAGKDVFVTGSFNGWNGDAKRMEDYNHDGHYTTTLMLPTGKHEYKFIVDGQWCPDPDCPEWVLNDVGTLNSVLNVN